MGVSSQGEVPAPAVSSVKAASSSSLDQSSTEGDASTHSTRSTTRSSTTLDPTVLSNVDQLHSAACLPAYGPQQQQGAAGMRPPVCRRKTIALPQQRVDHAIMCPQPPWTTPPPPPVYNHQGLGDQAERLLQTIRENHQRLMQYNPNDLDMNANNFTVIANSSLATVAQRFLAVRETFLQQEQSAVVDIGYHYTKKSHVPHIESHGLLTRVERQLQGLPDVSNGQSFGDGIYTSHNPYSYHGFAGSDVGLFCARVQGTTCCYEEDNGNASSSTTVLGRAGNSDEVCVLRESSQCIPLVLFSTALVEFDNDESVGNAMVHSYHCSLQRIMDEVFCQHSTPIPHLIPSRVQKRQKTAVTTPRTVLFHYTAPDTLANDGTTNRWFQPADPNVRHDACSICWNPTTTGISVALNACGHVFHEHCIRTCLNSMYCCPLCRACVGVPHGRSPSGSMAVTLQPNLHCLGSSGHGTIVIQYDMPDGVQASYHDAPGVPFEGVQRIAYIPNTQQGRDLLKRLKFAFCNGLTFCVGTSMTTGLPHRITWASIHHKTMVHCGAYGYPDASYFGNVNAELDHLHVPSANDL